MRGLHHRIAAIAVVLTCGARLMAAQATVVERLNGAAPTITVQGAGVPASGQLPPRDQAAPAATGSSRIRGHVVAADTGRPLRRATVRLNAPGVREQRTVTTDRDGQYEFTQLPAAQYTVVASKSGYVQMGYKQTRPNSGSRPLPIGERESRDGVDIALPPGGVISGRVVDEYGEPVSEVLVSAQRLQFVNGARRPVPAGAPSSSNDIGEFRIYGLAPADYYVVASPRAQGGPFDSSTDRVGYGQTYYPSAADPASAQRVTVRSGETLSSIVVALTPTRVARVSGTVIGADGRPANGGNVMMSLRSGFGFGFGGANGFIRPDGSFTISNVAPGEYIVRAMLAPFNGGPIGGGPNAAPPVVTASVTVDGTDLANVILQPQAPSQITGRLTGDPAALAQIQPRSTRIMAAPVGITFMPGPTPPPQSLRDDLSFELSAPAGQVAIRIMGLTGVAIDAVRLNGQDVSKGFDVEPGVVITDVEVEVTNALTKLVVTAANTRGEAVADRDVIVFPQDESKWGLQVPHSSSGRTDEQGRYESPQLLAGAYYVAATDPPEPGQAGDPEFLESLRVRAQRITLTAGETATVQLRVTDR